MFDSTQFINGYKHLLAEVFNLKPTNVRVLAGFVGGGFGGKVAFWTNTVLCAAAAKIVKRPVKLVLSREEAAAAQPMETMHVLDGLVRRPIL